jgi:hypothetical protein
MHARKIESRGATSEKCIVLSLKIDYVLDKLKIPIFFKDFLFDDFFSSLKSLSSLSEKQNSVVVQNYVFESF